MKKGIKILVSLVGLIIIYCLICLSLIWHEALDKSALNAKVDTILVLGSKVDGNNLADSHPEKVTQERLDTALLFAEKNPQATIVVSGGQGSDEALPEADGMAKYLMDKGISSHRIIKENKSLDTYENLKNSKIHLSGQTVIITNDFHLYRALLIAKKMGLNTIKGYPAHTQYYSLLEWTGYYGHEILGLTRAFILGK